MSYHFSPAADSERLQAALIGLYGEQAAADQLARYQKALAGLEAGGGVERFTAGSVSIQTGGGGARAAALRDQAEEVLAPWLSDGGFSFRGVPGGVGNGAGSWGAMGRK